VAIVTRGTWSLAFACAACSSSSAPATDAPSGFEFIADYTLEPSESATSGSASYAGGETAHFDLVYASFAASGDSTTWPTLDVMAYGSAVTLTIGPMCVDCPSPPYREMDQATVIWNPSAVGPLLQGGIFCSVPTGACGGTLDGSAE
jgi:hypothetical protein